MIYVLAGLFLMVVIIGAQVLRIAESMERVAKALEKLASTGATHEPD